MHYTLQSGQRSESVTSRCPICLKVRQHTEYVDLSDDTVCCSIECYKIYHDRLMALYEKAKKWKGTESTWESPIEVIVQYLVNKGI